MSDREYILGDDYTIADIVSWPWVLIANPLGQDLTEFPNVQRWRNAIKGRPAVQAGVNLGKEYRRSAGPDEQEQQLLFNQKSRSKP